VALHYREGQLLSAGAAAGLVAAAVPTLLEREEVARFASQVRDA
jgi:hypothetical protein